VILDVFLWAGERDMLELRLRTLNDEVDAFVAVTCTRTHQGQLVHDLPPLPAGWNLTRYVCEPDMSGWPEGERGGVGTRQYQKIERQHRDSMRQAAESVDHDHDYNVVVMCSDVDEIPTPEAVRALDELLPRAGVGPLPGLVMEQRFHSTALDYLHPVQPWLGTCVQRMGDLEPQAMRDSRGMLADKGATIPHAGFHFSWLGTDEDRARKLDTFSHAEIAARGEDPAEWRRRSVHANGEQLMRCDFPGDFDWPAPLVDGSFTIPESWRA
jgi:hypothetical protein